MINVPDKCKIINQRTEKVELKDQENLVRVRVIVEIIEDIEERVFEP
ncbi:hypothetical protein M1M92_03810 [Peptococcaceae bacterium]|nr:hypothetical protein [Peptococcaceae bacterium]